MHRGLARYCHSEVVNPFYEGEGEETLRSAERIELSARDGLRGEEIS